MSDFSEPKPLVPQEDYKVGDWVGGGDDLQEQAFLNRCRSWQGPFLVDGIEELAGIDPRLITLISSDGRRFGAYFYRITKKASCPRRKTKI